MSDLREKQILNITMIVLLLMVEASHDLIYQNPRSSDSILNIYIYIHTYVHKYIYIYILYIYWYKVMQDLYHQQ